MIKNDLIYQRHHIYKFIWQINIIRWCFHRTKQLLLFWDVSLYEDVYQWEFETATLANHMYSVLVYLFLCEFSAIFKPFCILRCVIVPGCSRAIVENSALIKRSLPNYLEVAISQFRSAKKYYKYSMIFNTDFFTSG
jgi:hypothetical protein